MKEIDCQDHYEILEVSPNAGTDELDRAYRIALSAYSAGSLASYSVFDEADAAVIKEKIELAYRVLSDPISRVAYDESIGHTGAVVRPARERVEHAPVSKSRPGEIAGSAKSFEEFEGEVEGGGDAYDGNRLRRARLRRGIDLDEVASVTKVNPNYLRCLEEDRFEELPARVYVRGFVGAYARAIGLDEPRVTQTYMAYFDEAGHAPRRASLLGRK